MESQQLDQSSQPPVKSPDNQSSPGDFASSPRGTQSIFSTSGISSWTKNLKLSQTSNQEDLQSGNAGNSNFSRFTRGLSLRLSPKSPQSEATSAEDISPTAQSGVLGSLTKGLVDKSKSAVKSVQVKARHMVSQNKRRYQEGGFDLDMTYITENIIAMGFPAGDKSSGFLGYVEGFYRNHMEEVIKFFETHHKGKYKVYNLCSERLYDPSLFEGKVACFPFDDHNCPPVQLIILFCRSAYSWLKEDIENVVAVHCKAGMARTGLMISSLLLYLKFFPTAEESMGYYNQKRCVDGKGLVLPSQIRYVKYFERILTYFNGENQPGRRCMIRGFRLHKCPHWIRPSITISNHDGILFSTKKHPRTKNLMPEDFWFSAPRKGIMVFALPGDPGLTEVTGDFKIHFHDRHGDFYCWLNTTFTENRKLLNTSDLDDFDKRKLPSPGFQIEVVLVDYDGPNRNPPQPTVSTANRESAGGTASATPTDSGTPPSKVDGDSKSQSKDEVFSDSEAEENGSSKRSSHGKVAGGTGNAGGSAVKEKEEIEAKASSKNEAATTAHAAGEVPVENVRDVRTKESNKISLSASETPQLDSTSISEFKAIAADASVFSFGDEDDYESD